MTKFLSTVSRNLSPSNYSWDSVVHQQSRPLLDSELNLSQDILSEKSRIDLPSGILSRYPINESVGSLIFSPTTPNEFGVNPFKALVAGKILEVKGTNSTTDVNKIYLPAPETTSGPGTDLKRTDFVFLEMWLQEVTPSMNARSRLRVVGVLTGDTLTIGDGINPDIILTEGTDFFVGVSNPHTARNIAEAINDYDGLNLGLTIGGVTITAETRGTDFLFLLMTGGANGNNITFTPSSLTSIEVINSPSGGTTGTGKPDADHIYYAGNVLSDSSLWLDDNIQDPNISTSSSRRVQIQYRIRVHSSTFFSPVSTPFGLDDGSIYAQGGAGTEVVGRIFSRHDTDHGLWIAGDGDLTSSTEFSSVDGFVYAIPLFFVFRRNQADTASGYGFNPNDDANTGLLSTHDGTFTNAVICVDPIPLGESDRPDGLFADEISTSDVLDLRRRVFPQGVDFSAALEYQFHALLDNTNRTWFLDESVFNTYADGTGGISTTPMVCDVFGLSDLSAGNYKRDFDRVSRRFSTAPLIERTTIVAYPQDTTSPTGVSVASAGGDPLKWYEGDVIVIDFSGLNSRSDALWTTFEPLDPETDNPVDFWVNGTRILDIGYCWHDDTDGMGNTDNTAKFSKIEVLSETLVRLTLDRNDQLANRGDGVTAPAPTDCLVGDATGNTGSEYGIYIEVILEYPASDKGLTETPISTLQPDVTAYPRGAVLNFPVGTEPHSDADNEKPLVHLEDQRRELSIEYIGEQRTDEFVAYSGTAVRLPYRIFYDPTDVLTLPEVYDRSGGANDGDLLALNLSECQFGQAETILVWTADSTTFPRLVEVTCYPLLACVPNNVKFFVYYRGVCPQTCGTKAGSVNSGVGGLCPDELELKPLAVSRNITTLLQGAGAGSSGYPFYAPYEQLGTSSRAEDTYGYTEWGVLNGTEVYLDDLRINTGMVDLPSFVPFVSSVGVTLGEISGGGVPVKDDEGRVIYPTLENASYFPSAFAKNLSAYYRDYKTCLPILMRVDSDAHTLYRKNEVVLVVFIKTTPWGEGVAVDMREDNTNLVVACVYRTTHLMLLGE